MRKSIWTILVMAWGLAAGAQTTLMIPLGQMTGSDQLRQVTITPLDGVTTYNGMLYNSGPITVQPTVGGATNVFGDQVPGVTTNLAVGGNLRLTWQGLSKAAQIYAPYGAAFVNAADPAVQRNGLLQVWTWTNGVTIAAGPGVGLTTNNGIVTVSATGLTNNNAGVVTLLNPGNQLAGTLQGNVGKLVILEDDWPTDQDNMMELDFSLKLMDEGRIKILATPYAGYSYSNLLAVPLVDAACRYYGHPEIVQCGGGLVTNLYGVASALDYGPGPFAFEYDVVNNYPSTYPTSTNYPLALPTYRRLLEAAPTNSVTMIFNGPVANLWDLWRSGSDTNSAMSGAQLIQAKVQEIIISAGWLPTNPPAAYNTDNLNYGSDQSWSWIVLTNMGVPVTFANLNNASLPVINGSGPCGTIARRPHTDLTYRVIADWDNVLHHQSYLQNPALGDAQFRDVDIEYQGSAPWAQMPMLYIAFGTNYHGTQIFARQSGALHWRPGNTEDWVTNSSANGDQGYLVATQPATFYHTLFSNYFASVHSPVTPQVAMQNATLATQLPLQATLSYWFRADSDGNLIDGWQATTNGLPDSSGNGNNLLALAGYQTPGYFSRSVGQHGALWFTNSASQILVCSNEAPGQVFTMFAVVNPTAAALSGGHAMIGTLASPNAEWRLFNGKQELLAAGVQSIATGNTTLSANAWYVLGLTYNNITGDWAFYVNGALDASGNTSGVPTMFTNLRYPTLGGVNTSSPGAGTPVWVEFWDGAIAEAGRYPSQLSNTELIRLFTALGNKYGVAVSTTKLPAMNLSGVVAQSGGAATNATIYGPDGGRTAWQGNGGTLMTSNVVASQSVSAQSVAAVTLTGSGSGINNLTAGNITPGGTLPSLNGAALTSLNGANVQSHTLGSNQVSQVDVSQVQGYGPLNLGGAISSTNYLGDLGYATNADYAAFGDELIQPVPYRGMCTWYSSLGDAVTGNDLTNWANIVIANSLQAYGWKIIQLDDGWQTNRDAGGNIGWNTNKLGILTSFIGWLHTNGMLFGIYTEPRLTTADGKVGSDLPHTEQDAATFASWGVDYVKLDFAGFGDENQMRYIIRRWRNAFRKLGRQVAVYSGGWRMNDSNWNVADTVRTLTASRWTSDYSADLGVYASYVDTVAPYFPYVKPGHYLDVDVVPIRNDATNNTAVMYGMNCVFGLPTMMHAFANDPYSLGMYKNVDLLAIQQDPLARAAVLISSNSVSEVWAKRLIDGRVALGFWNRDTNNSQTISVNFNLLGLSPTAVTKMKNVWSGAYSYATGAYSQTVVKAYAEVFLLSQTQLGPGVTEEVRAGAWALDSAATRLNNNTETPGNYSYDDGILNAGNVTTSVRLAVPAGVSNVCAIGWFQCSGTQWWTNDLFSFTYSADPTVGRQINNFSSPAVQGFNGLVPFTYYFPFSDTNTPKMISIRMNASTNSANRHLLSPIKLIYN